MSIGVVCSRSVFRGVHILDEGEVQVSQIVEDRPASCKPSDNRNVVCLCVFSIYLGDCVLVSSHNYGRGVPPEAEDVFLHILEQEFLFGQVEVGVGGSV